MVAMVCASIPYSPGSTSTDSPSVPMNRRPPSAQLSWAAQARKSTVARSLPTVRLTPSPPTTRAEPSLRTESNRVPWTVYDEVVGAAV